MSEEEIVISLRAQLVESLRQFCAEPEEIVSELERNWERSDRADEDLNESEARWVEAFRERYQEAN